MAVQRGVVFKVAVCALVVRCVVVWLLSDQLHADPDAYRQIAENLRQHGVYTTTTEPTAFRPPLYPLILATVATGGKVTIVAAAALNVLFGVVTVVLPYLLAFRWSLGRWSIGAAAMVAIDPLLLNQSALVMTETLATLLATAGLFALTIWSQRPSLRLAVMAGAVFGLACVCRPTFIPWLGLAALAMVALQCWNAEVSRAKAVRRAAVCAIALVGCAAMIVSPWAIRNYVVLGTPKATTTHGGYTVLLGNNPSFYRYLRNAEHGTTWDSVELASAWELRQHSSSPDDRLWNLPHDPSTIDTSTVIARSELEDDQFAYSLAKHYIRAEPEMFVHACMVRVGRLWQLVPHKISADESTLRMAARWLVGCWYGVVFVLAVAALVVRRKQLLASPIVWGLLLCFAFTAVHSIYWSNMRMRAPLIPFVCLLAAAGCAAITDCVTRRKA